MTDSGSKLLTRLYDKRDDFDFHIVNFPFLSRNIPSGPFYGVYISQLISYARCRSHYDDFRYHSKCLFDRLLSQSYMALQLEKSFKKFCCRYQDLIEIYHISVKIKGSIEPTHGSICSGVRKLQSMNVLKLPSTNLKAD